MAWARARITVAVIVSGLARVGEQAPRESRSAVARSYTVLRRRMVYQVHCECAAHESF